MTLTVKPASILKGRVQLPSSKSYSIRAFMIAACGGRSTIIDPSYCDDALVSIRVARSLGAQIKQGTKSSMSRWNVTACKYPIRVSKINVKESGTVLRFLLPLLALYGKKVTVIGEGTLRGRPNVFLTRTLRKMGVDIRGSGKGESIPVRMKNGCLQGGTITIDGTLSSQFISALLIASPQLSRDTNLILRGKRLVSNDYITMTCQVLKKSGIKIEKKGLRQYKIKGKQNFKGLKNFIIPSDYGLAAFLIAAAVLTKSHVTLTGHLTNELVQADGHMITLFKKMGVQFQKTSTWIRIKGPCALKGGNFSLKDCPDLVPIMSILALFAKGKTCLYDIGHVRSKESDRISDLRRELIKIGAKITEKHDAITINPQKNYKSNRLLDPHKDHRLAMSFCVLGSKIGARIKDIKCTHKSYPNFVKDLKAIGVVIHES